MIRYTQIKEEEDLRFKIKYLQKEIDFLEIQYERKREQLHDITNSIEKKEAELKLKDMKDKIDEKKETLRNYQERLDKSE